MRSVFDESGKVLYTGKQATFQPYLVKVSIPDLNIRKGPGTDKAKTGKHTGKGVFTIVEVADGPGASFDGDGYGWIGYNKLDRFFKVI